MAQQNAHNNMWLPVAAGLLGAGLALLFAPRSGRDTRAQLKTKATDLKEQAEDGLSSARETLDKSLNEAKDLRDRLTAAITQTGKKAKQEMEDLREGVAARRNDNESVLTNWEEEV